MCIILEYINTLYILATADMSLRFSKIIFSHFQKILREVKKIV